VENIYSGDLQGFSVRVVIQSILILTQHQLYFGVQDRWNDNTHFEPLKVSALNFFHSDSEAKNPFSETL